MYIFPYSYMYFLNSFSYAKGHTTLKYNSLASFFYQSFFMAGVLDGLGVLSFM